MAKINQTYYCAHLKADLALKRFHAGMYVRMLLEPAGRGKRLAALGTGVRPGARVIGPDVPLQVTGVTEHLGTGLARELAAVGQSKVPDQARLPAVRLRAQLAPVLVGLVVVTGYQVIVEPGQVKK